MSVDVSNQISSGIDQKLRSLSQSSNYQIIFRIHEKLRRENEGAYEPEMLSIGPYHRGKNNLQKMEKYKLKYLQELLKRQDESSARRYIAALMEVEEKARNYYAEHISLSRDDFVEMMLLDGCFIIEFLRNYKRADRNMKDDPLFSMEWLVDILCRDLLLFENQLPFFILAILFEMTSVPGQERDEKALIHLAISCLNHFITDDDPTEHFQRKKVFHLLSLMYETWCSSFARMKAEEEDRRSSLDQNRSDFSLISSCPRINRVRSGREREREDPKGIEFMKGVHELSENGIKFKKASPSTSWLDIKFENGVMKIPPLVVQDGTESVLGNLIIYEQYMFDLGYSWKLVTDYATFMYCLINSSNDVKTLRHKEIIDNWLGNDEEVSDMFNKMGKNVIPFPQNFCYLKVFKDVNEHCRKRRNTWRRRRNTWAAYLKKNYFSNPWSIISVFAASLLLLLTVIQTIFSVWEHFKETEVVCNC